MIIAILSSNFAIADRFIKRKYKDDIDDHINHSYILNNGVRLIIFTNPLELKSCNIDAYVHVYDDSVSLEEIARERANR